MTGKGNVKITGAGSAGGGVYEKVTIASIALADGKLANPAAIVTFKSKSCEARVKEFRAPAKTN